MTTRHLIAGSNSPPPQLLCQEIDLDLCKYARVASEHPSADKLNHFSGRLLALITQHLGREFHKPRVY